MPDPIACFALRNTPPKELGVALGQCFAEYNAWHGQASFLSGFAYDACAAGVSDVLKRRIDSAINQAEEAAMLTWTARKSKTNTEIAADIAHKR